METQRKRVNKSICSERHKEIMRVSYYKKAYGLTDEQIEEFKPEDLKIVGKALKAIRDVMKLNNDHDIKNLILKELINDS